MPTDSGAEGDPALQAVRAMLAAMPGAFAVFDDGGFCITANRSFLSRTGQAVGQGDNNRYPAGTRTTFSPDGMRRWTVVSLPPDAAGQPPACDEKPIFNEMIVNALPVMCSANDTESRYLFMNRFQAEIFGIRPEDAIGRTAGELLDPAYGDAVRGMDLTVISSGRATPFFEETYTGGDGVARCWLSCKVPLTREDGAVWAVATVSLDITERNRLKEGLRQAKLQADTANRVKSGFLAAMSHELRTPLNAVIGFSEILHEESLGPIGTREYRDYAGHILRSGQHLLALVNDILDFARIESGSLRLAIEPVDLGAMVRASMEMLAQTAGTAGVILTTDITEQAIEIHGDAQRLRQALLNVAGNAVKFTPAGGHVQVSLAACADGGAVITVRDSGIGIAESQLANVFDVFWQADSGLDRVKAGAGIGLPLAQQLIALHGGRLELQSRLGEGTSVTLTLPCTPPDITGKPTQ